MKTWYSVSFCNNKIITNLDFSGKYVSMCNFYDFDDDQRKFFLLVFLGKILFYFR